MRNFLDNFAALWSLLLLVATIVVLLWFVYWFLLRRIVRARKISGARDRRMLREAAERESGRDRKSGDDWL
jgi:hypothetical protein